MHKWQNLISSMQLVRQIRSEAVQDLLHVVVLQVALFAPDAKSVPGKFEGFLGGAVEIPVETYCGGTVLALGGNK